MLRPGNAGVHGNPTLAVADRLPENDSGCGLMGRLPELPVILAAPPVSPLDGAVSLRCLHSERLGHCDFASEFRKAA